MSQEPFGDIPLFREIQRLLASSEGPVNLEIARQVAGAVAVQGSPPAAADDGRERSFAEAVHAAEAVLSGYTRLRLEEPTLTRLLDRVQWARSTLDAWRWLLEHLARRFIDQLGGGLRQGGSPEANPFQAAMGQLAPLLLGIQTGTLVGHLSREVLARYDLPIPRDDDERLFIVAPNVEAVSDEYGFERGGFVRWLALHDTARHLVLTSVPWARRYARSLLIEVIDAIEIDAGDLERRFMELQSRGMDIMQEGMGVESMVPIVSSDRHRKALDRLRAFLALLEGYARHAAAAVDEQPTADKAKIEEGMARRAASRSEGEMLLSSILGVSIDRALETSGTTFCAAVVELKGLRTLNRVWEAPDNLPGIAEIKDPFAWIDRVLGE